MTKPDSGERPIATDPAAAGLVPGAASTDKIAWVKLSLAFVPLTAPVSDAKVLRGRQKPMTEIALLFAEIESAQGYAGTGFTYAKRAGGPAQYAHAKEIAGELIGEDPNDIARLWDKLAWAGASVGRSGLATQAIAAFDIALWDMKARRARLPLAKLLGAHRDHVRCYNTSGGFLSLATNEVLEAVSRALECGIGGIKIKVGQPDPSLDLQRVEAVRAHIGMQTPLMVDVNQQWDRTTAQRMGRLLEHYQLTWIEEPVDAYDFEGHAMLTAELTTPVASGEMLTSVAEHRALIDHRAVDVIQPDAPRVGGITPFLKILTLADHHQLRLAPHFAMEIHLHLAAAYAREPWVEHFEWLEPLFDERLEIRDGRMHVPDRPGLGITLSEQARVWSAAQCETGKRP